MEFADPFLLALALLAVPVALLAWGGYRRGYTVASAAGLVALKPTARVRLGRLLPVLRIAAVILFAAGIARPRIGEANAVVPEQGIDIALSVDVSSSMTTTQFAPGKNRLDVTKDVLRGFIKGRENDRLGLVVFQNDALALSPPTLDYRALDTIVAKLDSGILPDGTGIGIGLSTALNMLRESTAATRIVILLTDGEHNANSISPLDAAEIAKALHIRVYTIGVQSPRGGGASGGADDRLLKKMAEETGGQYYAADNPKALADVYDSIGRLEKSRVGRERFERFDELAPWFFGAAALFVLVEILLRATWLRRVPA
jgi:Ca-activated chloride channel family protein